MADTTSLHEPKMRAVLVEIAGNGCDDLLTGPGGASDATCRQSVADDRTAWCPSCLAAAVLEEVDRG